MAKILLVSYIPQSLESRRAILRAAGHDVVSAGDQAELERIAFDSPFDLAVLGHCATEEYRHQVASALRKNNPTIKIIMFYRTSIQNVELADALLPGTATPEDLLRAVTHLIGPAGKSGVGK